MDAPRDPSQVFATRVVSFRDTKRRIVLQDRNGPCPLLAVVNLLSLRGDLLIPLMDTARQTTTAGALINTVASVLLELQEQRPSAAPQQQPPHLDPEQHTQQIYDALQCLPRLTCGMDVNVHFTRPDAFEPTADLCLFDALRIPLLHGWIAHHGHGDADLGPSALDVLRRYSYNALTNGLAAGSAAQRHRLDAAAAAASSASASSVEMADFPSPPPAAAAGAAANLPSVAPAHPPQLAKDVAPHADAIRSWLAKTSGHQLTPAGLVGLTRILTRHDHHRGHVSPLAVLFRANHFSVLTAFDDPKTGKRVLAQLITDVALAEAGRAWETIEDCSGARTRFMAKLPVSPTRPPTGRGKGGVDNDHQLQLDGNGDGDFGGSAAVATPSEAVPSRRSQATVRRGGRDAATVSSDDDFEERESGSLLPQHHSPPNLHARTGHRHGPEHRRQSGVPRDPSDLHSHPAHSRRDTSATARGARRHSDSGRESQRQQQGCCYGCVVM